MFQTLQKFIRIHQKFLKPGVSFFIVIFVTTSIVPVGYAQAITMPSAVASLPSPGTKVVPSENFVPVIMHGMTIHPEHPLKFDFIIDTGDDNLQGDALQAEAQKLIKYFLASMTVPEDQLWVNLSPAEPDRIIPDGLGVTEMGRDMLAQDYLLKQLTASMMNPEDEVGKRFWQKVYDRAQKEFGTTQVPVNAFNKVWIVPDQATVYEHNQSAFVVERHLKVMLEADYLAKHHSSEKGKASETDAISMEIIRQVIIPELEREVNEGAQFALLRQVFNSMILATWYKKALKESLLGQVYMDQNKIKGIDLQDRAAKEKIYQQYVAAFEKGVHHFIKEEVDPATQQIIPRKYFSGGIVKPEVTVAEGPLQDQRPAVQEGIKPESVRRGGSGQGGDQAFLVELVEDARPDAQVVVRAPQDIRPISSTGSEMEHAEYNDLVNRLLEDGESETRVIDAIAQEIGAQKVEVTVYDHREQRYVKKQEWDLRGRVERLGEGWRGGLTRVRTRLTPGDFDVKKDKAGNIIVTLKKNQRYLILTNRKDPITGKRELIIVDDRFGADHAGRTRNQVYATSLAKAVHEVTELRLWKTLEELLRKDRMFYARKIDPSGTDGSPRNIREWIQWNFWAARAFDRLFHTRAVARELNPASPDLMVELLRDEDWNEFFSPYTHNRDFWNLFNNDLLEEELYSYSSSLQDNLGEMMERFELWERLHPEGSASSAHRKHKLSHRPTLQELMLLRNRTAQSDSYEVLIFKRKSRPGQTEEWFVHIGDKGEVQSRLADMLAAREDIEYAYHNQTGHPAGSGFRFLQLFPPAPHDVRALLEEQRNVAAVGDRKYIYIYSVADRELLTRETLNYEAKILRDGYRQAYVDVQRELAGERITQEQIDESFYQKWKIFLERIGYRLERYTWDEFAAQEDAIYEKFRDKTPAVFGRGAQDIIVQSGGAEKAADPAVDRRELPAFAERYLAEEVPELGLRARLQRLLEIYLSAEVPDREAFYVLSTVYYGDPRERSRLSLSAEQNRQVDAMLAHLDTIAPRRPIDPDDPWTQRKRGQPEINRVINTFNGLLYSFDHRNDPPRVEPPEPTLVEKQEEFRQAVTPRATEAAIAAFQQRYAQWQQWVQDPNQWMREHGKRGAIDRHTQDNLDEIRSRLEAVGQAARAWIDIVQATRALATLDEAQHRALFVAWDQLRDAQNQFMLIFQDSRAVVASRRGLMANIDQNYTNHPGYEDLLVLLNPMEAPEVIFDLSGHYYATRPGPRDQAMLLEGEEKAAATATAASYGGIDFNASHLNLQIKRDPNGVPLPVLQQPIDQMSIEGFVPIIIQVTPANVPLLLGAAAEQLPSAG